ncbi:type II toxin-antitoxin system RelE/ParE family toxin [Tianweitania sp.]|uniref:type II toxin-antitoxin system RelE/ParE family toxin n=1 Tax=Tianweitania sp. TaxID=2021634 RepID=UPI002898102F|nr:type II toxin-antitoxin system RelE/ParE family toxin [Tianweitania sp.]
MAKVFWLDEARDNVRDLFDYLVQHNPQAAERYIDALIETGEQLRLFPKRARVYSGDIRVLPFRNHLIFYRVIEEEDEVEILRVRDGRQQVEDLLDPASD